MKSPAIIGKTLLSKMQNTHGIWKHTHTHTHMKTLIERKRNTEKRMRTRTITLPLWEPFILYHGLMTQEAKLRVRVQPQSQHGTVHPSASQ